MIGAQIGTYRVLRQIGEGGMGAVWLAEHVMLGRMVAIKVLHRETSQKPDLVQRFFNEAKAATAISDPGIIQIFDFGLHTDGSAYIVMELLEGEALDRRLTRMRTLPLGACLRIVRQVAASLGAAHQRGIVHRDIKPENIFLVRDPEVAGGERTKVLDFGIAKISVDKRVKTHTSAVMGTPTFMSPEQCRGAGQVDQRSDVYSLGCVLFMLLTGRPPFDAEGAGEIIAMHLREPPPAPSTVMPGVPPAVDALVLRCLAKDRTHRFDSGAELAVAVEQLLAEPVLQPFLVDLPLGARPARAVTSSGAAAGVPRQEMAPTGPPSVMAAPPPVMAAPPSVMAAPPPVMAAPPPVMAPAAAPAGGALPAMHGGPDRPTLTAPGPLSTPMPVAMPMMTPAALYPAPGAGSGPVPGDLEATVPTPPITGMISAPLPAPRAPSNALTTLSNSIVSGPTARRASRWWIGGVALVGGVVALGVALGRTGPAQDGESASAGSALASAADGKDAAMDAAQEARPVDPAPDVAPDAAVAASVVAAVAPAADAAVDAPSSAAPALDPRASSPPAVASSAAAPPDSTTSEALPSPTLDSPQVARDAMLRVVQAFKSWSEGKSERLPCPTLTDVAAAGLVPALAAKLRITCTRQPANQRIGVEWAGPDGELGTGDDLQSWKALGAQGLVPGQRWGQKPASPKPATAKPPKSAIPGDW